MRNMKWYLRAALLLPLATVNYLKTQGTKGRAILIGVPAALLVLILALALHHRDGKPEAAPVMAEASAVETAAVETTPTPPPTPSPVTITLSFAGDCTLGMDDYLGYEDSFNQAYDREGPAFFLEKVKPIFAADDLTVVNFEGPLTESTEKEDKSRRQIWPTTTVTTMETRGSTTPRPRWIRPGSPISVMRTWRSWRSAASRSD